MNNITYDSVIPALQSMIARNRNTIRDLEKFVEEVLDDFIIPEKLRTKCKKLAADQKVLKKLLAREYAEERIREFNKQCQLMRNK